MKRLEKENKTILSDLKLKLVESENRCRALEVQSGEKKGEMNDMLQKHNSDIVELSTSGLQRGTILSDKWHAKNPFLCAHVFGFHTFDEFKVYCACLFPDTPLRHGKQSSDDEITNEERNDSTDDRLNMEQEQDCCRSVHN